MKMKNFMMAFVCLFTVVALCSCDKDDDDPTSVVADNTITATVENGSSYNSKIDIVKAEIDVKGDDIEVSAPYSNGGFTLKLPETISGATLFAEFEDADEDDYPERVTVSDRNVKTAELYDIEAYKSNNYVGYFYTESSDGWELEYIYANGDVSITGAGTDEHEYDYNGDGDYNDDGELFKETYKFNIHLKKGWNIIYGKEIEKGDDYELEVTTQAPASTIKWYFKEYSSSSESSVTKKVSTFLSKRKARL